MGPAGLTEAYTLVSHRGPKQRAHQQVGISVDLHRWQALLQESPVWITGPSAGGSPVDLHRWEAGL